VERSAYSLNGLSIFLSENLIEQGQVIQPGKIWHLAAEKPGIERLLGGGIQLCVQGIGSDLQARERVIKNGCRQGFAGFTLDLLVQQLLGLGLMSIDPVGQIEVRADPILYQVGMRVEELRVDYEQSDDELPIGPKSSFVHE
jgi:hypothetical protein